MSALTLRTPSESRIASQSHIEREKEKQVGDSITTKNSATETDTDIQITACLSPDEDGTPFTRSQTPKSHPIVMKTTTTPSTPSTKTSTTHARTRPYPNKCTTEPLDM